MKNAKPPEVFSPAVFGVKSDVMDLDTAETDIGIQQDGSPGIGVRMPLIFQRPEGVAGICSDLIAFGNQNGQFTESAACIDGAVFRHFLTAAEVNGQGTETQIDFTAGQSGRGDQKIFLTKAGIALKAVIFQIAAAGEGFVLMVVMDMEFAASGLF